MSTESPYDAILVVSFGGPEGPEDVIPFLENVLRGKNVPHERMLEVAEHYQHFGGVSPINEQNRRLIAALKVELETHGPQLPIYWGNRNWHPMLTDTLRTMHQDGVRQCLAFVTSAFSSYSGCRQYREDMMRSLIELRDEIPEAELPRIDKIRAFFNHPGFIEAVATQAESALGELTPEARSQTRMIYTAHSIPLGMASNCQYEAQLKDAARLISERLGFERWDLVYQSRSGPPSQPWLEPDIVDHIESLHHEQGIETVAIAPLGFVSDHMEVLFDLDTEARQKCDELGMRLIRIPTVGTHPRFITTIRELIRERCFNLERAAIGDLPALPDRCPADCCLSGRPGVPALPAVSQQAPLDR